MVEMMRVVPPAKVEPSGRPVPSSVEDINEMEMRVVVDTPYGSLTFSNKAPSIWTSGQRPLCLFTRTTSASRYLYDVVEEHRAIGWHLIHLERWWEF